MNGELIGIAWKPLPRRPMIEMVWSVVTIEHGVAEDVRGAPGDRQITILFEEDWLAACAALGVPAPWTVRRANFFIRGLTNPRAPGAIMEIGAVRLAITGETTPCANMDRQVPGLRRALEPDWRGGLTARVLEGGRVDVGAAAAWADT